MTRLTKNLFLVVLSTFVLAISCTDKKSSDSSGSLTWNSVQDSTDRVAGIDGFSGPEAVRYDPAQDVYFVSNFTGGGNDRDADGFISRVSAEGGIDSLRFMTGTEAHPLHAPRGMYITGDTLWAADVDGVHGFNRISGEQLAFVDFTSFEPGFLNDVVQGTDGNLYVTDTGKSVVYQIKNGTPSVYVESLPAPPNGITLDPGSKKLILALWEGHKVFYSFGIDKPQTEQFAEAESGGNFDGIEFVEGRLIAASQQDSSLHLLYDGSDRIIIHTPGRPADIGIDTKRMHVAVPYIALNRVDIWQLPEN